MAKTNPRFTARARRKRHIRKRVSGTPERPRLTVFRSTQHVYAQIIDDTVGKTLVSASTMSPELKDAIEGHRGNIEAAKHVGALLANKAKELGISQVVFDRNGYLYHGRVAALAQSARDAGLDF
ncbi:MAG: 50S ribosomal protein L18 [Myxococcota bacterium]